MEFSAFLTSAGINIGVCALLLSLYSVLRRQPENAGVYFSRRLKEEPGYGRDVFMLERLVPSPSWIVKACQYSEEDILNIGGLDAVVFVRLLVFSMRIFSIAAVICIGGVLPLNYNGQQKSHVNIREEPLDVFAIANVKEGSKWVWVHCVALYIISFSAYALLYIEYKGISRMRLLHVIKSPPNPSHFTILVRGIPESAEKPFSATVESFFSKYHASTYLSHQIIFKAGKVQKIMGFTKGVCKKCVQIEEAALHKIRDSGRYGCGFCGAKSSSQFEHDEFKLKAKISDQDHLDHRMKGKESAAAFVFFRTRYAALVASDVLQSSNPMHWVTDPAPEPRDVYWSNLWLHYRQLWLRRIVSLVASIVISVLFLIPVAFVQALSRLELLQKKLPFLRGILKKSGNTMKFVRQLITGYLPSVVFQLFLMVVPPVMILLATLEGPISHSARKKSAMSKVLYFTIWNVFFANVLSGSVYVQLSAFSSPKDIPLMLAKFVPAQATFFITYVLTSGWASLSSEVMRLFPLLMHFIRRYIFGLKDDPDSVPSFPYHTEVPRVLLFGLLGFTCSVLAPLILPFLLVYFFLGYVVYRNQIVNVYSAKYGTGGLMWPMMHNATIFSLVLAQIIALGVFGLKKSPISSGFMIPLIVLTLLFNEYCRQRFHPAFKSYSTQDVIDMDREDELQGRLEEIYSEMLSAYRQFPDSTDASSKSESSATGNSCKDEGSSNGGSSSTNSSSRNSKDHNTNTKELEISHPSLKMLPLARIRRSVHLLTVLMAFNSTKVPESQL